jgi:DNA polymerase-3 subunit beta
MKIECELEKIKNAINQAEKVTGKNLTLPVLEAVLLIASKKTLKIRATNLSLGVEIEVPVSKIEKEGTVAVSGAVLSGIFSNLNQNEKITIEEDSGNLFIQTKRNKIKIKGQLSEDFPTIPVVEGESFEIEAKKITDGMKSVYYSAAVSDVKPEISSVFMYTDDSNLVFVATDSFRLAEKKIKIKKTGEVQGVLIPFRNVSEILKILNDVSGDVRVCFNKNQISFTADGVYLTSRIIDGVFPDYRQIIPKEDNSSTEVVVLKQDLLNALKISNIFSDKFNQLNLTVRPKDKTLELSSQNNDVGENKTVLEAAVTGEPVELAFNYKYFLDCFQSVNSDSLIIKLNQNSKPIVVSGVSDKSFLYLIMPMNR